MSGSRTDCCPSFGIEKDLVPGGARMAERKSEIGVV